MNNLSKAYKGKCVCVCAHRYRTFYAAFYYFNADIFILFGIRIRRANNFNSNMNCNCNVALSLAHIGAQIAVAQATVVVRAHAAGNAVGHAHATVESRKVSTVRY